MKHWLVCFFILFFVLPAQSQINMTKLSQLDQHGTDYANIWGYTDSLGREYALLGCNTGTAIIEITNPSIPVERAFIPGGTSIWHEIQSWGKYAYVVSEAGGSGLQIIDLSLLPATATLVNTWTTPGYDHTHDIQIRDGYAYLTGGNSTPVGGIKILSLADPVNPVEVGSFNNEYIHDCYVRNDTVYAAAIFSGRVYVIDAKNKSNLQIVHSYTYPGAFTHNTALSDNGQNLFTTDETSSPAGSLRIWDISTLRDGIANNTNITQLGTYGSSGIVHNVYAKGKYAYASYYTEGVRIFDVSNPSSPVVAGHYDTYTPNNSAQFAGAWGVYPYFPSGNIVISDISGGLFVLSFSGKETGGIGGIIHDATTGLPILGASVTLLQDNLSRLSTPTGAFSFTALTGNSTMKITKEGYQDFYTDVAVPLNQTLTVDVSLVTSAAPAAPKNLTVVSYPDSIILRWRQNNEMDFLRYRIYADTLPNPTILLDSTFSRSDTMKVMKAVIPYNRSYYFRITAVDSAYNESYFSNSASGVKNTPPATPFGLSMSVHSLDVTLRWNRNYDNDFLRYRIYGGTSPMPSIQIDSTIFVNDTIKTITLLYGGATWYFRIKVVDSYFGTSDFSNEVQDFIDPPTTPTIFMITSDSARVTLRWSQNLEDDFLRYRIYGGTSPNPLSILDSVENRADTIRTINGLTNGMPYYFRITVVDSHKIESGFSTQVTATPKIPELNLTTSLYQNSLLTKFVDIVVVSDVNLAATPTVKLWLTTDTTVIPLTLISQNVYKGSYTFNSDGIYKIRTQAVSYKGQDSTKLRTYSVTLAKPGIPAILKSVEGMASLQIMENAISEETCFMSNSEQLENETAYHFGPEKEFSGNVRVEIQYDPNRFTNTDKLFVFKEENGVWKRLDSQVLTRQNKVAAYVNKLGVFKVDENHGFNVRNTIVKDFYLKQNYPNPFNPSTTIEYDMPEDGYLSLVVYNLLGQRVRTLYDAPRSAGRYRVVWDGRNESGREAASGIYLYRLQTENFVQTKRMLFIK